VKEMMLVPVAANAPYTNPTSSVRMDVVDDVNITVAIERVNV
jgi:hypothetical protein